MPARSNIREMIGLRFRRCIGGSLPVEVSAGIPTYRTGTCDEWLHLPLVSEELVLSELLDLVGEGHLRLRDDLIKDLVQFQIVRVVLERR